MAEALIEEKKKSPRKFWPLTIGFGFSILWGLFTAQYFIRNFSDISGLPSNSFGDVLAGFFAPLAFVWLFVATLLQRQELELQREELAETREVLAQQKAEMEKAANENLEQTKIMKENLTNELIRSEYDLVDTLLYTTALFIAANRYSYCLIGEGSIYFSGIDNLSSGFQISKTSFDMVLSGMNSSLIACLSDLDARPTGWRFPAAHHASVVMETYNRLLEIQAAAHGSNRLIQTRLDGLGLLRTVNMLKTVMDRATN